MANLCVIRSAKLRDQLKKDKQMARQLYSDLNRNRKPRRSMPEKAVKCDIPKKPVRRKTMDQPIIKNLPTPKPTRKRKREESNCDIALEELTHDYTKDYTSFLERYVHDKCGDS